MELRVSGALFLQWFKTLISFSKKGEKNKKKNYDLAPRLAYKLPINAAEHT